MRGPAQPGPRRFFPAQRGSTCDIGVGSTGRVWVAWRQFEFKPDQGRAQNDAVAYVYSDDGGRSFTKPALAHEFVHWDMGDTAGDPAAFGQAGYEACLAGDGTLGRCESPEPKVNARDCGEFRRRGAARPRGSSSGRADLGRRTRRRGATTSPWPRSRIRGRRAAGVHIVWADTRPLFGTAPEEDIYYARPPAVFRPRALG